MFNLRHRLARLSVALWLRRFKAAHPHVQIGEQLRLKGRPIFAIEPNAFMAIGRNVTFTSDVAGNLAGIFKPCSVAVQTEARLSIGDRCGFSGVSIFCAEEILIGNDLTCGVNVCIWDTDFHPLDAAARRANDRNAIKTRPIRIGNDVFLGANCLVLKGAMIGDRSVLAAGSIVTGTIPPDEIWGGNPAKFLKRNDPENLSALRRERAAEPAH